MTSAAADQPATEPVITVSRDDVLVILHQRPHTAREYGDAYNRLDIAAAGHGQPAILSPGERDLVHADLAGLLRALGLGDHARPQSPHEVMTEAIAEVRRIRTGRNPS